MTDTMIDALRANIAQLSRYDVEMSGDGAYTTKSKQGEYLRLSDVLTLLDQAKGQDEQQAGLEAIADELKIGGMTDTWFILGQIRAMNDEIARLRAEAKGRAETLLVELGCAGHLCVSRSCAWKRHTQVGNYRVSSIGNYFPGRGQERGTIGGGEHDFFETMVFRTTNTKEPESEGCGCLVVDSYSELEGRRYATAGEAQAGHEAMVAKYRALVGVPAPHEGSQG